jgi:hypothetical protein
MHNEFTAVIENDDDWHIGYCPEVPVLLNQMAKPSVAQ